MITDQERQNTLRELGQCVLDALQKLARYAADKLTPENEPTNVLALLDNPMTEQGHRLRSIKRSLAADRQYLARLTREPFVARLKVEWETEEGTCETLYITRASAAGIGEAIQDARVVSYRSPLGRLAEFAAGEGDELDIAGKRRRVRVRERLQLRPKLIEGEWDGLDDRFEFEDWSAELDSIRALLSELEGIAPSDEAIPGLLGQLLDKDAETTRWRDARRRRVVQRIALRDQPILDHYQGEVFRLPINSSLVLLGPPGTGKTTTLIKRLAQKRTPDGLTDDETEALTRSGLSSSVSGLDGWAMFSPTELLKQYLRDAFTREGVPATPENLRTWQKQRLELGRGPLRILRAQSSGRFLLDEHTTPLTDRSSPTVTELQAEFEAFFNDGVFDRGRQSLEHLRAHANEPLKLLLGAPFGFFDRVRTPSPRELAGALDQSDLHAELQRLQKENRDELRGMGNRLVRQHPALLDEMVDALPQLLGDAGEGDEPEDDDGLDEAAPNTTDSENERVKCAQLLLSVIRGRSRSLAAQRGAPRGRVGRALKMMGTRLPPTEQMQALGACLVTTGHVRTLAQLPRTLVMGAPVWFDRFRRTKAPQERFFTSEVDSWIDRKRVSVDEVDVMILTMLRNARLLLEANRGHLVARSRYDWLESIKDHYLPQVFVDEATDFSAVQLACTVEISDPRLRSWFACGDLNQRITVEGVRSRPEFDRLGELAGRPIAMRRVNRAYRQSKKLQELASALAVDDLGPDLEDPGFEEAADLPPQLAEDCRGANLGAWLTSRITEVEKRTGYLPSIAVFVHDEGEIDSLVAQLGPRLAGNNIPVAGLKDGRAVGDVSEVRVFDVRHVKGLEFEAVFYVGIDRLANRLPELFDRYFFVGISRAATYLGVTCEGALPQNLETIRSHFETGGWAN